MKIVKGQNVTIYDREEEIKVEAQILAVVEEKGNQYIMILLAEDDEEEAMILKIGSVQTEYQILWGSEILGYGTELDDEREWQQVGKRMEQEGRYISN